MRLCQRNQYLVDRSTLAMLVAVSLVGTASVANAVNFTQTDKLTASNAAAGDVFGNSVAISGNLGLVGAPFDDRGVGKSNAGSVYVFDTTTGSQLLNLAASDGSGNDHFGWSVGLSGDYAIVGALDDDDNGDISGSAYLFNASTGSQLFKLTACDGAAGDEFGISVGISGNRAVVGADLNDDAGSASGSAYLYDVATGNQIIKLTASDADAGDQFGRAVAISGNIAIVGAQYNDDAGTRSGSAYLFNVNTGSELFKLVASGATAEDEFGMSVGISGDTAIVGAGGAAYLFDVTTGAQIAKLTTGDVSANGRFGQTVAISGNIAMVGARTDDAQANLSGSAFLFEVNTGTQFAKLTALDAAAGDQFGYSVAISGSTALIGAAFDDDAGSSSGSAYVFAAPVPTPAALPAGLAITGIIWCRRRYKRRAHRQTSNISA